MEIVYNVVKSNPEFFTWAFGIVNVLWAAFVYFNKQSHDRAIEKLKYTLSMKEAEALPLIKKLQALEDLAGEAKEVATSYRSGEQKREFRSHAFEKLGTFAGQFSKYPKLTQAIRNLNQYCAIMAERSPHESCREDVLEYYKVLIVETENVRRTINA